MAHIQPSLFSSHLNFKRTTEKLPPRSADIQLAINSLAKAEAKERGAIFTRKEIVNFILDLTGYISKDNLSQTTLLEPSFGSGDFLVVALQRLLKSFFLHNGKTPEIVSSLRNCLRAVELNHETLFATRKRIIEILQEHDVLPDDAEELADTWLIEDDFLLTSFPDHFTHIIGNPPYLRQELIPDQLISHYRTIYKTIYDRADLYIPFIERSLSLLAPEGKLSFICSDRWVKNKYGGPLRDLISENFHLQAYVDMVGADAFTSDVAAYPAILLLTTRKTSRTYIVHRPIVAASSLASLAVDLQGNQVPEDPRISVSTNIINGSKPWIMDSRNKLTLLHRLENDFPLIENDMCKIGIGVATGCDNVYIGKTEDLPIEEERKLPLLMVSDIQNNDILWNGRFLANPFDEAGNLVNLHVYPKFAQYLLLNEEKIKNRHVARKNPVSWYRTIDKVSMPLTYQAKLLIPDIKGEPTVVYDEGKYYPHHNLYHVTSTQWDLRVLQAILQSPIAKLFVSMYSVKMRGGYLRFQAQYIRRIHVPHWKQIPSAIKEELIMLIQAKNESACNEIVFRIYQLSQEERCILQQL